jgi:hypothetical protein
MFGAAILADSLFGKESSLSWNHYLLGVILILVILYRLYSFALDHHKNIESDFIELTDTTLTSNFKKESDTISLCSIEEAVLYNLLGNVLMVVKFEGKEHEINVSGYENNLIQDLSNNIGSNKVRQANFIQTVKYITTVG